jgi:hypothetical protein
MGAWQGGRFTNANPARRPSTSSPDIHNPVGDAQALPHRRRFAGKLSMRASIAATPRNKRRGLRQHRQHRRHDSCLFSDPRKVGVITSRPMTAGSTDNADGTDAVFCTCAHPDHSRPCAAFTGCQSRRDTRRHTYRFFPVALAVLPRTTFAAPVGFDALAGSAERAAAALVRRTPG